MRKQNEIRRNREFGVYQSFPTVSSIVWPIRTEIRIHDLLERKEYGHTWGHTFGKGSIAIHSIALQRWTERKSIITDSMIPQPSEATRSCSYV